jgi:hypothetical protein
MRKSLGVTLFCHNTDSTFSVFSHSAVQWISDSPGVAVVSSSGLVAGKNAGGPVSVIASVSGKQDTAKVVVYALPPVIQRINFQCVTPLPFRPGWVEDIGAAYDSARGFGWETPQSTCRNDRNGATFLLQSLIRPDAERNYRVNVPDGDYVLRVGIGDNAYGEYLAYVLYGTDTLVSQNHSTNTVRTDSVTVSGGKGLNLRINGAVNYLVIASQVGTPLDLVANDGINALDLGEAGGDTTTLSDGPHAGSVACALSLSNCSPNPFASTARIALTLPSQVRAHYGIYNLRGQLVKYFLLPAGASGPAGMIMWDGRDSFGNRVPQGVYVGRLTTSSGKSLKNRMVLLR